MQVGDKISLPEKHEKYQVLLQLPCQATYCPSTCPYFGMLSLEKGQPGVVTIILKPWVSG